ncbi:interferon-activable protein [Wolffia australiana]
MEPADIDWKSLEWQFVKDDVYEHFSAPKWNDFSSPSSNFRSSSSSLPDDEAWFCRPDCRHPKTAEDFLSQRSPAPGSQRKIGAAVVERNSDKNNILRETNLKGRGVQSPAVKTKKSRDDLDLENQDPNLCPATPVQSVSKNLFKESIKSSAEKRDTPPARNLFPKREILTQISEFCNEIKKLATIKKDRGEKPLPAKETSIRKEKMKRLGVLQEIRSSPPTPQRIDSANPEEDEDVGGSKTMNSPPNSGSRTIDLFWFLKPCSSYL